MAEPLQTTFWNTFFGWDVITYPCRRLTHWGRETQICVGEHANIGSDNGLSPYRRQAIIWTNAGILLIEPLGTNFNEILIEIHTFSLKKMHLKISSGKWRPFYLALSVLTLVEHKSSCLNGVFVPLFMWVIIIVNGTCLWKVKKRNSYK